MQSISSKGSLKLPQIVALYIGAVLGSGILILPGIAAEDSGPASLISWGLMIVLVLPMASTIGLLSAKHPNAGGVAHFVSEAFHPIIGSLFGWLFTMAVLVGAPVIALTGAGYLCAATGLDISYRVFIAVAILGVGLIANYLGMRVTGRLQTAVVATTLLVLIATIAGSITKTNAANFSPFLPNGWGSVGHTTSILFWCFIGWEAVSNLAEDFQNPQRDAMRGSVIAAGIIGVVYFLAAFATVGTHSYGSTITDASLIHMIKMTFGRVGAIGAGFAALFICVAPAIAYIGAIARMVCSLAESGFAPKVLAHRSKRYQTPLGGLYFLAGCFCVLLIIFETGIVSLAVLIQIPSAAFILTYMGGCAAGVKLLKGNKLGVISSTVSLILSTIVFAFAKWTILYPVVIGMGWAFYMAVVKKAGRLNTIRVMKKGN